MLPPMNVLAAEPILAVRDVARAIAFYRDVLGFEREWLYQDPPVHAGISFGRFQIMFARAELMRPSELFFRVDDVAALEAQHRVAGATVAEPLQNKPWGVAEYAVLDPDGHRLRFAGARQFDRDAAAVAALPAHYRIDVRTPSVDDFARLKRSVGWDLGGDEAHLTSVLARSTFCVVASDARTGEAVGMLRVDGHGRQFTIWDVMVRPADQQRRVGSAMLDAAIAHLRTIATPGSFVGLFSTKPAFYERVGFQNEGGLQRRL